MKQLSATIAARDHVVDRISVFETRKSGHECARWRYKIDCTILARRKPETKPAPCKAFVTNDPQGKPAGFRSAAASGV